MREATHSGEISKLARAAVRAALAILVGYGVGCASMAAGGALPEAGLVLWLRADRGVEVSGEGVVRWHDQSAGRHKAEVPEGFSGPALDTADGAVVFSAGSGLRISGRILPESARELTVLGVARANSPSSIGLFSIRNAARPLVQLDVDGLSQARFIVRDGQSQTITATTPCMIGAKTLFGGVLEKCDDTMGRVRVLFGEQWQSSAPGPLASPLMGEGAWIGTLRVPGRESFFWDGSISEVVVYNRALGKDELLEVTAQLTERHKLRPPAPPFYADSWNVLSASRPDRPIARELECDVCVVGGGSAGVAAAIVAGRDGARVVLVERQGRLGGTGANAFVSNWEPGPGCSLAREMYDRMKAIGGAGVAHGTFVDESLPYELSLVRARPEDPQRKRVPYSVPFTPAAFDRVARDLLAETGKVTLLDQTTFFHAEPNVQGTRVQSILVEDAKGAVLRIQAKVFVDSTGDVWLARNLGCETMLGIDPKSRFDEPSAPEEGRLQLNAITRCYTIRASDNPKPAQAAQRPVRFPKAAFVRGWEGGVLCVNMMPTLPGRALIDLGYDECMRRSEAIVRAHWHWLQKERYPGYEFAEIAPMLGIREGHRVVTRYVLSEHDILAGLPGQQHPDLIAVADHPCDVHGAGGGLVEVKTAYGVPYRCLIPAGEWENLLVACRGSGFSSIAASSVRLQRTMIQLGHAAGMAAAMAAKGGESVDRIDVQTLVERLDARSRYPIDNSFLLKDAKKGHE